MNRLSFDVDLCFFGHSHSSIFTLSRTASRGGRAERPRSDSSKRSTSSAPLGGAASRSNPKASYAIFDSDKHTVYLIASPTTLGRARKIHRAGLPSMLGDRLIVGL
jgi:hypothetical protein